MRPFLAVAVAAVALACSSSGSAPSGPRVCAPACDASAGETCVAGACLSPCARAAAEPSSAGCEFWAVDLDQQDYGNDPASAPWGIVISNPGALAAAVTVTRNDAAPGAAHALADVAQASLAPGATTTLTLATRELDCGATPNDPLAPGTCLSSRAYRVVSSMPVVVRQFNTLGSSYSADASLLLPTSALGREYRVLGWAAANPIPISQLGGFVNRAYVTVVGTAPDTLVTVRPSWRIRGNAPIPATAAGGTITARINAFDVLNLETDDALVSDDPLTVADLSGTLVTASAPVAVFSGAELALVPGPFAVPTFPGWDPGNTCCADHLEEQLPPLAAAGRRFVLPRSPVRSARSWHEPDVLRFVGGAELAHVTTSLPPPFDAFTLGTAEVVTTSSQVAAVVSSDRPILVGQLLVSRGLVEGSEVGDPSLVVLAPVEQLLSDYFLLDPGSWASSWAVITAPVGAAVTLDGVAPAGCVSEPAGTLDGVAWESRACPLPAGAHRLGGAAPFGAIQVGYGPSGSYALVAGSGARR